MYDVYTEPSRAFIPYGLSAAAILGHWVSVRLFDEPPFLIYNVGAAFRGGIRMI